MGKGSKNAKIFLSEVFDVDPSDIPSDASLESYKRWDSLNHMRIILHYENIFGILLTTDKVLEITDLVSIQKLLDDS